MMDTPDYTTLFVVGCPRSGTTWIQLLLDQHPAVATAPETQIFAYYLVHFQNQWEHERRGVDRPQGRAGLSRLLSEEEFEELCRNSARFVLDRIAARKPGAKVVLEKSPKHALQAAFIKRVLPGSRFIHVLRDPRDAAASLLAAGRSWGGDWAPRNSIGAARMWMDHVKAIHEVTPGPDVLEIKYEDVQAAPVPRLMEMFEWLGIPSDEDFCKTAVANCSIDRLRDGTSSSNQTVPGDKALPAFFRKGKVGGWQSDLTPTDIAIVEHICREEMARYGYLPSRTGPQPRRLRIPIHDGIQRVRESIDWQISRFLHHV